MNLFVYGTLLFPPIRNLVGQGQFEAIPAELPGYSIRKVRNATFPGIVRDKDECRVAGALLVELTGPEIARFDSYEDSFYCRTTVTPITDERTWTAETYVVPGESASTYLGEETWTAEWFREHHYADFLARLMQAYFGT